MAVLPEWILGGFSKFQHGVAGKGVQTRHHLILGGIVSKTKLTPKAICNLTSHPVLKVVKQ